MTCTSVTATKAALSFIPGIVDMIEDVLRIEFLHVRDL